MKKQLSHRNPLYFPQSKSRSNSAELSFALEVRVIKAGPPNSEANHRRRGCRVIIWLKWRGIWGLFVRIANWRNKTQAVGKVKNERSASHCFATFSLRPRGRRCERCELCRWRPLILKPPFRKFKCSKMPLWFLSSEAKEMSVRVTCETCALTFDKKSWIWLPSNSIWLRSCKEGGGSL